MFNPIEEKRRFVQVQIHKSFDSGINVAEDMELEKAHKDGDHHPTKPWVWVSSANGGKGDWRVEGGRAHKKAGASTTTPQTPAPRKAGSTDEIERTTAQGVRSSILGLNNIATNVKDNGDHFKIDFDANDFNTNGKRSPQIDRIAKFLESMGASCVIGKNSIKAYKNVKAEPKKDDLVSKVEYKATDILKEAGINDVKKVAKVSTMGDVITISYINMSDVRVGVDFAKNGKISGNARGNHARESKIIAEIVEHNSKTSKTSDKRDKIAQDAGFKDYKEMKGYQDYVTQKNLLKKKSTKAGMRLLYEQEIAKYEKEHADLIKKIGNKK